MTSASFINSSVNSNSYSPDLAIKHQTSISKLLRHRIEIAKSNQNFGLLTLLEQESQQLEQNFQKPQVSAKSFWSWLITPTDILIEQVPSVSGGMVWRGYNPLTGHTRYGETEAEMIDWLEH